MSHNIEFTKKNLGYYTIHKDMKEQNSPDDYLFTRDPLIHHIYGIPLDKEAHTDYLPPENNGHLSRPFNNVKLSSGIIQWYPPSITSWSIKNYRRDIFRDLFKEKYGDDFKVMENLGEYDCHILYISFPLEVKPLLALGHADIVIYDRTDYWPDCVGKTLQEGDLAALRRADIVICSSQFIYDKTVEWYNDKSKVIPVHLIQNGGTRYDVSYKGDIDRYAYAGRDSIKVDYDWMNSLDKEVDLYGDFPEEKATDRIHLKGMLDEKEMVEKLTHYKAGLMAFTESDWTKGMFPIKLYNYLNAGLPVLTHNCPETDLILSQKKPEEILDEFEWHGVFNQVAKIIDGHRGDEQLNWEMKKLLPGRREDTYYIWWSLSLACNFNCSYCCQRSSQTPYKPEDVIKSTQHLADLIKKDETKELYDISILGGEPALFDLHKMFEILNATGKPITINVLTNFALKDREWWEKLYSFENITTRITASCHAEQMAAKNISYDDWADKAKGLPGYFVAKFVVNDKTWPEAKRIINKYIEPREIKWQLEGCRDKWNRLDCVGEDVLCQIRESRTGGIPQTDRIQMMHGLDVDMVECDLRFAIKGDFVVAACKYGLRFEPYSLFDVKELPYKSVLCPYLKGCNLCMTNRITPA